MPHILHITNGSSATDKMRAANIPGTHIAWDDVLHEGPVPIGLGPAALRERRAEFLASYGWASYDAVMRKLTERDETLEEGIGIDGTKVPRVGRRADEIVLWFEHDLFDQLQLIQILDRLPVDALPRVTAVHTSTYLGQEPAERYRELFAARQRVTSAEHLAGRDAWTAFRAFDPRAIVDALPRVSALPHLPAALQRHLQQFPSEQNGLSRTERQTLEAVADGLTHVRDVYTRACEESEEALFMSDAAFSHHISSLIRSNRPLLRTIEGERFERFDLSKPETQFVRLEITDDGRRVLEDEADRVTLCGIDRWLGGVHVHPPDSVWRWDERAGSVRLARFG